MLSITIAYNGCCNSPILLAFLLVIISGVLFKSDSNAAPIQHLFRHPLLGVGDKPLIANSHMLPFWTNMGGGKGREGQGGVEGGVGVLTTKKFPSSSSY